MTLHYNRCNDGLVADGGDDTVPTSSSVERELTEMRDARQRLNSIRLNKEGGAVNVTVDSVVCQSLPSSATDKGDLLRCSHPCTVDALPFILPPLPLPPPSGDVAPMANTAPSNARIRHKDTWREVLVLKDHPHPSPGHGNAYGWALPVNNGTEGAGRCMVIDLAMMQIKNVLPHPRSLDDATVVHNGRTGSYFRDMKRTFQGIVWGRFKCPGVPMLECVTGQAFHRPPSDLAMLMSPPTWTLGCYGKP